MATNYWIEQRRQQRITRAIEVSVLVVSGLALLVGYVLSALSYYPVR